MGAVRVLSRTEDLKDLGALERQRTQILLGVCAIAHVAKLGL